MDYLEIIAHCGQKVGLYSSMTFCFSLKVLKTFNPVQVNIKREEGLHNNNQGSGTKTCTITSRFRKLQYGLFGHTTSQLKKTRREK